MTLSRHTTALDGLRGLAIIMVIASHAFPAIPELPWTVKRFTNLGFYGVQLFFVVSALTLANSWRRAERAGPPGVLPFALRRVFRIAPAYFLAAALYAALRHAPSVPASRWLTFLTFTNGFSPAQMPTVPGAYVIVPGGWSIAAEFAFYALFPVLMTLLRTRAACAGALVASLPLAWAANSAGASAYGAAFGQQATDQFLYYWLPNQLPVFLTGLLVFACAADKRGLPAWVARRAGALSAAGAACFLALGIVAWPRLPALSHGLIAAPYLASACFAALTLAALARPPAWLTHPLAVRYGQASFSAYLTHFAILDVIRAALPRSLIHAGGVFACASGGLVFILTIAATGLAAQACHRWIELPFIALGGRLAHMAQGRPVPQAAA